MFFLKYFEALFEHFMTTDSKFCSTLRKGFFQVASNCSFRFCLCCFSVYKKNASSKVKVNENPNQRALFNQNHWDIVCFSCDFIILCFLILMGLSTSRISAGFGWPNSDNFTSLRFFV